MSALAQANSKALRHNLRRRVRLRCQHYFVACHVVSETDLVLTMPQRYTRTISAQFRIGCCRFHFSFRS